MKAQPCIFCQLSSSRKEKHRIIYRDERVIAFADNAPINRGHVLVIPIKHATYFTDVPPRTVHAMTDIAGKIIRALQRTRIPAEAVRLQINSGKPAGQVVMHTHLHIIPHNKGEKPGRWAKKKSASQLGKVAATIRRALRAINAQ
jgi:histidine triad (HIT) family protein